MVTLSRIIIIVIQFIRYSASAFRYSENLHFTLHSRRLHYVIIITPINPCMQTLQTTTVTITMLFIFIFSHFCQSIRVISN